MLKFLYWKQKTTFWSFCHHTLCKVLVLQTWYNVAKVSIEAPCKLQAAMVQGNSRLKVGVPNISSFLLQYIKSTYFCCKSDLRCVMLKFNTKTKLFCHKVSDKICFQDKCLVTNKLNSRIYFYNYFRLLVVKLGSRPCPCQLQITHRTSETHSHSLLSRSGPRADSIIAMPPTHQPTTHPPTH